ncbi:MAG: saccharopine dehydrogenase family protein [Gammaproteobacteria bacterium]|nr:MAG: saccharopine dehydrogenase family protein [Gammaproteobacteria bacterium]
MTTKVAIIGAGKIGEMICTLLLQSGDYEVTLVDKSASALAAVPDQPGLHKVCTDVSDTETFAKTLKGCFAVLSACPYYLTVTIARAALRAGIHYLDLTEDVASTRQVKALADGAHTAFIPQCGLAPGFISILAYDIAGHFNELDTVHLRVGALPQYPTNTLTYNLTWSTDGVINEYCEPCEAIVNGELCETQPLEQREEFSLDGITYESFNTSGGLGTLGETLLGKVRNLNYQTIRYPGHRDIMKTLLHDLRLSERRDVLKDVLENALPATLQDVVLIFVTVSGKLRGKLLQESYANKIYAQTINGQVWSAIQITTAAAICTILDLLLKGRIPTRGFVRQEQVSLDDFLKNRFGSYFRQQQAVRGG